MYNPYKVEQRSQAGSATTLVAGSFSIFIGCRHGSAILCFLNPYASATVGVRLPNRLLRTHSWVDLYR